MAVVGIQPSRTTVLMYAHPSMQSLASSIVKICSEPGGFDSNLVSSKSDIQPITPRHVSTTVLLFQSAICL